MHVLAEVPLFFRLIFPWPFIGMGCLFAYRAVHQIIRASGSNRWPTIEGKVALSKIEVTDTGGDYPHDVFAPIIEYKYTIDGVSKTSRRLAMADINPSGKASAEAVLKRYKVGSAVRVYLSPQDHEMTILEPGVRWPLIGKLVFGLLLLGVGVSLLWVFDSLHSLKSLS